MASFLDDAGDIDDALLYTEPVPYAKDPLNLTADECRLRLLHTQIKHNAVVPFNPGFKALPCANPPRPAKLRLLERFADPDISVGRVSTRVCSRHFWLVRRVTSRDSCINSSRRVGSPSFIASLQIGYVLINFKVSCLRQRN